MTWIDLRDEAIKEYYPALALERLMLGRSHWLISAALKALTFLAFLGAVISVDQRILGLFFILFGLWIANASFQAFFNSFYFKDVADEISDRPKIQYELARVLYRSQSDDLLGSFLKTEEGIMLMARADIPIEIVKAFLAHRQVTVIGQTTVFDKPPATFSDYVLALFDADSEFSEFLFARSIQKKDVVAIADWITERAMAAKQKHYWWSRNRLGRIPSIGSGWAYGRTYRLEEYSRPLPVMAAGEYEVHTVYGTEELKEIESVLVRGRESNVFLVGNDRSGLLEIIARLSNMIEEGTALTGLKHKRVILLDTDVLIATMKTKGDFEIELLTLLHEAAEAGNVILVIEDFPSFVSSSSALGSNIISLLDPFLTSEDLQFIGLCDMGRYHDVVERDAALMERFDPVIVREIDELNTVRVLENEIISLENKSGLFFTYPALLSIVESAERYFPDAEMPDKAIDLLDELAPRLISEGKKTVGKDDVLKLVKAKTGIPVGEVEPAEREKLLNLEKILHQRIIGQDEAIDAIANAVRRARSGITSPNRPLASFLFLGPTGVGKTETTKALGEVFFGREAKIERLDMSEYAGPDALSKLIGSFEGSQSGVLSALVREHPYAVLLLDEFEKTTSEVMNIFLQVLDEGFFSDNSGKRVNARNLLIIATSNAGSDLIWEAVKHGDDLSHAKELITDSIVKAGIFKPELLNRFDGIIIFHPLASEHLEKIAKLQLEKLKKRMAERGINLVVNDDLVRYVVKFGTDPKFGARPMNRAIQDKVEQIIAKKLIKGELKPGSEVGITQDELA